MQIAKATTARVNSSREPVRATCHNSQGNTRCPTTNIKAIKAETSNNVCPMVSHSGFVSLSVPFDPPNMVANEGKSTRINTVTRSSTINQPTAMRPFMDSRKPRDSSAFSNTTVLAQDNDNPRTNPAPKLQPHQFARAMPRMVATAI